MQHRNSRIIVRHKILANDSKPMKALSHTTIELNLTGLLGANDVLRCLLEVAQGRRRENIRDA